MNRNSRRPRDSSRLRHAIVLLDSVAIAGPNNLNRNRRRSRTRPLLEGEQAPARLISRQGIDLLVLSGSERGDSSATGVIDQEPPLAADALVKIALWLKESRSLPQGLDREIVAELR